MGEDMHTIGFAIYEASKVHGEEKEKKMGFWPKLSRAESDTSRREENSTYMFRKLTSTKILVKHRGL